MVQAFTFDRSSSMPIYSHTLRISLASAGLVALMGLSACAGMTQQEKNTAIGVGVGAIGGSILTGGSTAGAVGGGAVGGLIGHEVNKK
jgi:osmotically inducible lipoprotein OsmB